MSEYIIEIKNIRKKFPEKEVLKNINLSIKPKEFVTFLGPSGCGKTTTLRIISGFENATEGDLFFEGKKINTLPPYKRQINTVFQKYALFPHLNVYENIAFGLNIKKIPKDEINKKVMDMLKLINLEGFETRKINSLSGGQQQRIAIARALVCEPKVLLLDEPLGALDLKLRKEMQLELKNMQQELGITFIYVTHDQEEALTMSDRIVVINNGQIQQIGTPEDIYNEPKNRFVADFIGESNITEAIMVDDFKVEFNGRMFNCLDKGFEKNEKVDVVIRPEDIEITSVSSGMISGVVESVVFKGVHYEIFVRDNNDVKWMVHTIHMSKVDDNVEMIINPEAIHVMKRG